MIRTFKVRLFPTKEQEQKFYQHIGCCRFVWNYMIELQQKRKENKEKHLLLKLNITQLLERIYLW